jgi:hypothetical protein
VATGTQNHVALERNFCGWCRSRRRVEPDHVRLLLRATPIAALSGEPQSLATSRIKEKPTLVPRTPAFFRADYF